MKSTEEVESEEQEQVSTHEDDETKEEIRTTPKVVSNNKSPFALLDCSLSLLNPPKYSKNLGYE